MEKARATTALDRQTRTSPSSTFEVARHVVNLPFAVGPFATSAIEPNLGHVAVAGQQFGELFFEIIVVCVGAVGLFVSVPGLRTTMALRYACFRVFRTCCV